MDSLWVPTGILESFKKQNSTRLKVKVNPCRIIIVAKTQYGPCKLTLWHTQGHPRVFLLFVSPPCPHPDWLVVLLQGQRGRLSSQPALDYIGEVEAMEEGDAEGEGPMAGREGPSDRGLLPDASSTTTNNLLASVKEQVKRLESFVFPPYGHLLTQVVRFDLCFWLRGWEPSCIFLELISSLGEWSNGRLSVSAVILHVAVLCVFVVSSVWLAFQQQMLTVTSCISWSRGPLA